MMGEIDRLRPLEMRVAWNDDRSVAFAKPCQRSLEAGDILLQSINLLAKPQSHIERYLVVPRAARVQLRRGQYPSRQLRLDVHMNILQFWTPSELAFGDFVAYLVESFQNPGQFAPREHTNLLQHRRVRLRSHDILPPEPPIE